MERYKRTVSEKKKKEKQQKSKARSTERSVSSCRIMAQLSQCFSMNNAELASRIWQPSGTQHKLESKQKHRENKKKEGKKQAK